MRVRQTSPSRMVLTARGTSSLRIGSAVGQASAPPWMSAPQLGLAMGGLLTLRGALRLRRALTVASRVKLHLDCFVTLHLDCFLREEEWARRDATAPALFAGQTEPLVESLREGRWGGGRCNM
ncbi:hypothetical protein I4F81_007676 [Pyropia yezoensis]|uniref:Uncharacterized protein n=1 Tax=Pyropia yezoensis TaxID=2788 RepID=A0ACC3C4F0_PYRYE|nr:hypothetical protein I4F81_007676 [Neopyropia yezoensis]